MRRRFFGNSLEKIDLSKNYLKIEALEDFCEITLSNIIFDYCIDNGVWVLNCNEENIITLNTGQIASFRCRTYLNKAPRISASKRFNISGNIHSLLFGNDFEEKTDLDPYQHRGVFSNLLSQAPVVDASKLILPATSLCIQCYTHMFYGCALLTEAPKLPATTINASCYSYMFHGCTSLTTAPELPATTLDYSCYEYMFYGCTALTSSPVLSATTLANYCYKSMFEGCTSLTTAPSILPATTLSEDCYAHMFYNCKSLITVPELPATTLAENCYGGMFYGCMALTTAPELPATTLAEMCYGSMFSYCTSLTQAPELPATTLTNHCYYNMFHGCSKLNYIKMLATDIRASYCLFSWVSNISRTGTFVKHPNMTSLPTGTSGIPSGWAVVNDGEENKPNLITFTIDGVEYQAEEGMTWEEWVNSEYNKIQMVAIGTGSGFKSIGLNPPFNVLVFKGTTVYGHDLIITGGVYIQQYNDF